MKRLLFVLFLGISPAMAQTTTAPVPQSVQQIQQVITQVQGALNGLIQAGQVFIGADLDLATAQANAAGNTVGAKCWQTIKTVQLVPIPQGAGIAWYKERFLELALQYVNINQDCSTVAPAYVRLFNQFIQQAQSLNL